ncbi:MAG TPA: hypothetical protein VHD90_09400 [Phototrophicaceae bacterium]|nr:hypothetical protein [Phototrophicaceae bacterium]
MRRSKMFWFSILGMLLCLMCALGAAAAPVAQSTPSAPSSPSNQAEQFVFDARADLELLADKVLTPGVRPPEWKANSDVKSPTVVSDLWFDNELLANAIFGPNQRPDEWIGATVPVDTILARNVRHDLEMSADQVYGKGQRPAEWRGAAKIVTCDRTLQNVLTLLDKYYNVQSKTPESALNYCLTVESEIEDQLVNIVYGTADANGNVADPISQLSSVRGDLERLADELLGLNTRPDKYIGNRDTTSPSFISDIRLDLELLADTRLGVGKRPAGWIGGTSNSPAVSYLNLRHDLELLADTTMGIGKRPHGWQGTDPVQRCDPLVQNLSFLDSQAFKDYNISNLDQTALDYCAQIASAANTIVENPPKLDVVAEENMKLASSNYAFAYLDVGATQYMGIMPGGVSFRALYRNFGDSSMMFVQGDDFAVYVDMHFTTVSETVFRSLPTLEGVDPLSFCDAKWCNGPGPTPTPTGSGPLLSVLVGSAPVATPNIGALQSSKQLVSWNQVRVTYVFDDLQAKQAQVALEICPNGATNGQGCEPVTSVFDKNTNASKPVASVFNGMNVFVFRYGYSTNLIIESDHYYSQDVWISDPTLR